MEHRVIGHRVGHFIESVKKAVSDQCVLCIFCGEQCATIDGTLLASDPPGPHRYHVSCRACRAAGPERESKDTALEAWLRPSNGACVSINGDWRVLHPKKLAAEDIVKLAFPNGRPAELMPIAASWSNGGMASWYRSLPPDGSVDVINGLSLTVCPVL